MSYNPIKNRLLPAQHDTYENAVAERIKVILKNEFESR
jgi:hypothetical protein